MFDIRLWPRAAFTSPLDLLKRSKDLDCLIAVDDHLGTEVGMDRWKTLTLGQRVRQARLACNWTQERLAEALQTSVMTIRRWEHDSASPQARFREQLCKIFHCSNDELFGASKDAPRQGLGQDARWTLRRPHDTRVATQESWRECLEIIVDVEWACGQTRRVLLWGQEGGPVTPTSSEAIARNTHPHRVILLPGEMLEPLTAALQRIVEILALAERHGHEQ